MPTMDRIDSERLNHAKKLVDYVIPRVLDDGRFHPDESLWAETATYQSSLAATLAVAGKVLDDQRCLDAAATILGHRLKLKVDGLWSLDWWWDHRIYSHPPENWREQNRVPDPRYTASTLLYLGIYHRITGDDSVVEPAREAMSRMFQQWDFLSGEWQHMTMEFVGLATWAWEPVFPEMGRHKEKAVERVVASFVDDAPFEIPFVTTLRTTLLLAATGDSHLHTVIKPGIDALLAEPALRFEKNTNDFKHTRSTWEHVNIRGNGAVAVLLRTFDQVAGEAVYTGTPLYKYLANWLDGMRDLDGGYFECKAVDTGDRFGKGSPGQYVPLWWMLGARLP